ncbi:hypothetical protein GCM10009565_91110 [Amycolatopsis albidoflavus]
MAAAEHRRAGRADRGGAVTLSGSRKVLDHLGDLSFRSVVADRAGILGEDRDEVPVVLDEA